MKRGTNARPRHGRTFQFASTLERSTNRIWGCHFVVPDTIARQLIDGKSRRVRCSINNSADRQCALIPQRNGSFVITVNKQVQGSLGLSYGAKVTVILKKDTSEHGLPFPEEFRVALKQDSEGRTLFRSLTPGRQRTLLYIVGSAKDTDKRINRSLTIIKHLKTHGGTIDYKHLNQSLRSHR